MISKFLADYRAGTLDKLLGLELRKVTEASQKHKQGGSLTINISLKPIREGETEVTVKFTKKLPQRDTMKSVMFVDQHATLVDEDPSQLKLFDRVEGLVDNETGEVIVDRKLNQEANA